MQPVKQFRDDINGLRAWAVVSVILFHFGIPGFAGGFVGVDVFFVIAGLLLLSLILSVLTSRTHPSAAFFMLHTRMWEMLAGALVFLLGERLSSHRHQSIRQWLYYLGFALIAFSITAFDSKTIWPGWHAMVPVVGTVMVLLAARQGGRSFTSFCTAAVGRLVLLPLPLALAFSGSACVFQLAGKHDCGPGLPGYDIDFGLGFLSVN